MANLPLTRIEETAVEPQPAHINKRPKLASAWGSSNGRTWVSSSISPVANPT